MRVPHFVGCLARFLEQNSASVTSAFFKVAFLATGSDGQSDGLQMRSPVAIKREHSHGPQQAASNVAGCHADLPMAVDYHSSCPRQGQRGCGYSFHSIIFLRQLLQYALPLPW
jgi:hypothetical protein